MKQQLVESARAIFRRLPISMRHKQKVQQLCFLHAGGFFKHMPAYQMWLLQNPELAEKLVPVAELPGKRQALLATGAFSQVKPAILMVTHSLGGGTEHHVQQLTQKLELEGVAVWALRALGRQRVRLMPAKASDAEPLVYDLATESDELLEQLRKLDIRLIHVHHLVDFAPNFDAWLMETARKLGVLYDATIHDYFAICPRYTLYDEAVRGYCGEPDVKRCQGCVNTFGSAAGKEVDVRAWRETNSHFLSHARRVYTPDADVQTRMLRHTPQAPFTLRPHWDETAITPLPRPAVKNRPRRIMTLGAIAPHKGSMVLKECAEDAKVRNLSLDFTLIGFSDIDWMLKKHVKVTGPYKPESLPERLREGEYDIVFLPAVWPETFNYTLSEVLHYGLYPVSFDIGAIGRRIQELGYGTVLPYDWYRYPQKINDALLAIELPESVPVERLQQAQMRYRSIVGDYYNLPELGQKPVQQAS